MPSKRDRRAALRAPGARPPASPRQSYRNMTKPQGSASRTFVHSWGERDQYTNVTGPTLPDPARSPTVPRCPHPWHDASSCVTGLRPTAETHIRFRSAEVKDRGAALTHTCVSAAGLPRAQRPCEPPQRGPFLHIDGHRVNTRIYGLKRRPSRVEANDLVNMGGEPARIGIADRGGCLYRARTTPVRCPPSRSSTLIADAHPFGNDPARRRVIGLDCGSGLHVGDLPERESPPVATGCSIGDCSMALARNCP